MVQEEGEEGCDNALQVTSLLCSRGLLNYQAWFIYLQKANKARAKAKAISQSEMKRKHCSHIIRDNCKVVIAVFAARSIQKNITKYKRFLIVK